MATLNKLVKNLAQQFAEQSASWGSLMILVCMLGGLILMMAMFSQRYPQVL